MTATTMDRADVLAGSHRSWNFRVPAAVCAAAVALLHLLWVTAYLAPAIMSPDANGYVVQARLIAEAGRTSFATESPVQYVGMHWLETTAGEFHSRYPAGLPLLFALAWKIGGLPVLLLVNPLLASGTVLLVFWLARRLMSDVFALLAAVVMAIAPSANQHALDADAHIAASFFLVAGTLAILRFADTRRLSIGFVAGLLLGIVPTVRYPEAIVGVAIGAWLLWRVRPVAAVWPAVIGAAVPLVTLMVHNAAAYGAFWRTGYALTNEQTGFGLDYFVSHALPYLQALGGQGLALMFAFGAAGLAALVSQRETRGEGLLFAGIVVPLVLLYMAYYFGGGGPGGGGSSLRFLIPTYAFFAVAAAWLLGRMAQHLGAAGAVAVAVVAALQLLVGIGESVQTLAQMKQTLASAARVQAAAAEDVPAGSVLIVDRSLAESLDALGRWKLAEEALLSGGGMGGPGGGPGGFRRPLGTDGVRDPQADNRPSPQQVGKNKLQQERYAGLSAEERRARAWADVATWAGPQPVYWFVRSVEAVEAALPRGATYENVAEVEVAVNAGSGGMGLAPGFGPAGRGGMPGRGGALGPGGRGMPGDFGPGGGGVPGGRAGAFAGGPAGRRGAGTTLATKLRLVRVNLPKN